MKKSRLLALPLVALAVCLLLPLPAQADATDLAWSSVEKPGSNGYIVVSPSEVNDIAVGNNGSVYAVDSSRNAVYRSNSGGGTWEDITQFLLQADAGLPATMIAVAPDNASVLAAVTDGGTNVYLSTDAGATWYSTGIPALGANTIQSIAISRQYATGDATLRDIAIGTADWGNDTTTGRVWVFQVGAPTSAWRDQGLTIDGVHSGGEVAAVAFSPNYQRDNTIIAVAATAADMAAGYQDALWLCAGALDISSGTTAWNVFSGYPVEVGTASSPSAGDGPGVTLSAAVALPSNYSGADDTLRKVFVSYDRTPDAGDDVYRLDDTTAFRLNAASGSAADIASLSYYGTTASGKLLAGGVTPLASSKAVPVWRTADPLEQTTTWLQASTPPSGPGNARVSWGPGGEDAYCGTSTAAGPVAALDESAFSVSSDDGDNWQQLSLIDTTLQLSDLALSPNSDSLFVATYSTTGPEGVWRTAGVGEDLGQYWSRQLTMDTTTNRVILRMSPDYATDYTIYAIEAGGTQLAFTHDRGNSWQRRRAPGDVVDAVVADRDTIFIAMSNGSVRKSTDDGFIWSAPAPIGIAAINMLSVAVDGTLFVGGRNGEVAYSTDGGASFTRLEDVPGSGDVQVIAGANFKTNGFIYAATASPDAGLWRWKMETSTEWEQIDLSVTALHTGASISGLMAAGTGTLYVLRSETGGGIARSLNPAADMAWVSFDTSAAGLPANAAFDPSAVFSHALPYLKTSGEPGSTDLWSIDTTNESIYRYRDTMAAASPGLIAPEDGTLVPVNPQTGDVNGVTFIWTRPSLATTYSLVIALDSSLTQTVIAPLTIGPDESDTLTAIMTPATLTLTPGNTYYWGVRATVPLAGPWSAVRSFTIAPEIGGGPPTYAPVDGATITTVSPAFSWSPVAGATEYELQVSTLSSFEEVDYDGNVDTSAAELPVTISLETGQNYFWRVRAIEPVVAAWSGVSVFSVAAPLTPAEVAPPMVITEVPAPVIVTQTPKQPAVNPVGPPPPRPVKIVPDWLRVGIIIGGVLVITMIVLIMRTGR